MNDLLIATHDQALHAIGERLEQPGTDPTLTSVVCAVIAIHVSYPSPSGRADPDCPSCEGKGWFEGERTACDGLLARTEVTREHCHCRCPWCSGCEEPVCDGPCPTVEAIADRLGLLASSDLTEGEDHP